MTDTRAIPLAEVDFVGMSFTDFTGRLFRWRGELYRAIPAEMAAHYAKLFSDGVVSDLVDKGLFVESALTKLKLDGYELVVWHRTIKPIVYPHEWCHLMLSDAAKVQVQLAIELERHGLICEDAHPLNIVFDSTHPVFVDLGSAMPLNDVRNRARWHRQDQFDSYFLQPLRLMRGGHSKLARWLLREHPNDPRLPRVDERLLRDPIRSVSRLTQKLESLKFKLQSTDVAGRRLGRLKSLMPELNRSSPTGPPGGDRGGLDDHGRATISSIIGELSPTSILDISAGSSGGEVALLAADSGAEVRAADFDERFVSYLYSRAKAENLALTTLVLDVFSPSHDLSNFWYQPATKRLASDLVLAVGTLDRWVLKDHIRLEIVAARLWEFTSRWLLIDFVHRPVEDLPTWSSDRLSIFSSFTLDQVVSVFSEVFDNVEVTEGESSRFWLLCENQSSG